MSKTNVREPLTPRILRINVLQPTRTVLLYLARSVQPNRSFAIRCLVSVSGRVVLWTNDKTSTLLSTTIDSFNDIDQLLLILQDPVELIVVSRTEIAHHVLVSEEEHECNRIVEFVHLFEVGNLIEIANVDYSEVFDLVSDFEENFILSHAVWIPIATKSDDNKALLFRHDGLVDMPAGGEMG